MADNYLTLSRQDRLEALGVAATASGRPVHLLEKDIWVVWTLDALSYQVRELIPDLAGDGAIPKSNSQAKKWQDAIDKKLSAWVRDKAVLLNHQINRS
jgi:hypothetical protein